MSSLRDANNLQSSKPAGPASKIYHLPGGADLPKLTWGLRCVGSSGEWQLPPNVPRLHKLSKAVPLPLTWQPCVPPSPSTSTHPGDSLLPENPSAWLCWEHRNIKARRSSARIPSSTTYPFGHSPYGEQDVGGYRVPSIPEDIKGPPPVFVASNLLSSSTHPSPC